MTFEEVMSQLESMGNEKVREFNSRHGVGDNQFGVKLGDLRTLAKTIKINPELSAQLWETGNQDARLLATLIAAPKKLSVDEVDAMVGDVESPQLADWVSTNILKPYPQKEELRQRWMTASDPFRARAGWSLTAERVIKNPDGLDLSGLLDRIEQEMGSAHAMPQWTMNYTLAEIGINFPEHRERALAIGEKLGVLRDYPVSKGCVSPYAPIWITEMVRRKG